MTGFDSQNILKVPLTEALCQLQFDTPATWNGTVYGIFFDAIRHLGYSRAEDVAIQGPIPAIGTAIVRYHQENGPGLLQLSPSTFSVHYLAPYPGWPVYKPHILDMFQRFRKIVEPGQPHQLVLKYINRFSFVRENEDLTRWFTFRPLLPPMDAELGPFILRCKWDFDEAHSLIASFGIGEPQEGEGKGVILELDFVKSLPGDWKFSMLADDVEHAHTQVKTAFTAFMTTEAKQFLDEVTTR